MRKSGFTFGRICNPTAANMSIYNADERIENPYIQRSRIANPAERQTANSKEVSWSRCLSIGFTVEFSREFERHSHPQHDFTRHSRLNSRENSTLSAAPVRSDLPPVRSDLPLVRSDLHSTAANMSVYNADERIENPYIQRSRIANPSERGG